MVYSISLLDRSQLHALPEQSPSRNQLWQGCLSHPAIFCAEADFAVPGSASAIDESIGTKEADFKTRSSPMGGSFVLPNEDELPWGIFEEGLTLYLSLKRRNVIKRWSLHHPKIIKKFFVIYAPLGSPPEPRPLQVLASNSCRRLYRRYALRQSQYDSIIDP